jgi:hypothetical protein
MQAKLTAQRQHKGQQREYASQDTHHPTDNLLLLFAAPISSIGSNHHNKYSNSLQVKIRIRTPLKHQGSECRPKI